MDMWLVQLPSGLREAWGWSKRVDNPFFRCAPVCPPRPPQLRGRGRRGRGLPRGRGWGVGPFRGGRGGPLARGGPCRRPVGRYVGPVHSARGAVIRARAAARLRSRGASRGAFCAPARGSGEAVSVGDLGGPREAVSVGDLAPAPAGGSMEAVSVGDLAPTPAGGSVVSVGDLAPVSVGESGVVMQPGRSVPRRGYALALGSALVESAVVSPGGPVLGTPAASASPGGSAVLSSVLYGGSATSVGPSFRGRGRRAPRSGGSRFSSRGSSLRRSSPESAVSPRPPCPAPAAFWTFCSPFPASEGPREPPSADVDLSAHSFDLALASEDEEFARDVDSRLLYTN